MAPKSVDSVRHSQTQNIFDDETKSCDPVQRKGKAKLYITRFFLVYYHCAGIYGLYLGLTSSRWVTIGLGILLHLVGILGVTAGAHRLWSHRGYKAKMPLQIILMLFHSIAFQKNTTTWVKIHRLHHKYSDTDADPHNANRGLFFSHIGWLVTQKSDAVVEAEKKLDMTDIYENPVLSFQRRYATLILGTLCFIMPTVVPMYFWGETFTNAWHVNMFRFIWSLHVTCCINSVAHKWGYKPYDKSLLATQSSVLSFTTLGEGFHNYHHVFPWDYKTSEFGNRQLNFTTRFIDLCSKIGWAYDLKSASDNIIHKTAGRTGDGTDLWGHKKTY